MFYLIIGIFIGAALGSILTGLLIRSSERLDRITEEIWEESKNEAP